MPASAAQGELVTVNATPNPGYRFVRWEVLEGGVTLNNANSATATFTMPNTAVTIRAVFEPATTNTVTATANNTAWGTATSSPSSPSQGATVTLTATPSPGYRFVRWEVVSGSISLSNANAATATFTMPNTAVSVRAVFESSGSGVTTSVNNTAWGTASSSPSSPTQGATVTLTATPNTGYRFVRWEVVSGSITLSNVNSATATFTMPNTAVSVRAVFEAAGSGVTTSVNNTAWGTAAASPASPSQGATVTLTATPSPGYRFVQWEVVSGSITLSNVNSATATFTMPNTAVSVRAVFEAAAGSSGVTTSVNNTAWGAAASSPSTPAHGASVTLSAMPNPGYRFVRWEVVSGGVTLSNANSASTTFTMPNTAVSVMAVFAQAVNLDSASGWARPEINRAISAEIVPPQLQSSFRDDTTRAEFAAIVVEFYETVTGTVITGRETFADTNDVNVEKTAYIGVVNGVGNNMFAPDRTIDRQEAAVMLARLANAIGRPLPNHEAVYADNDSIASWAAAAVGQMQGARIMEGVGENKFSPRAQCTREQSIIITLRLFDLVS